MRIQEDILNILAECRVDGNVAYLPQVQLDRKTYLAVNDCLESIGGKWNRKTKGHVFDESAGDALEQLILTGETTKAKSDRQIFQYFPTPREIGDRMCEMAEINEHSRVLEPSAGEGALVKAIIAAGAQSVYCVELNPAMIMDLEKLSCADTIVAVHCGDFLAAGLGEKINMDRVVMNPPFSRQQDIDHIREAYNVLALGGVLVSIVSESPFFRTNKKSTEFCEWLRDKVVDVVQLPEGAFKSSGTMVRARIIKLKK